jgi:malate dehydrogenase (oxaloacetate-decarboxylating)(NADP+)
MVNNHPSKETLIDIATLTHETVKLFNIEPVMAMLSYSNFGNALKVVRLWSMKQLNIFMKTALIFYLDGEMQVNFALDKQLRHDKFPFSKLMVWM